MNKDYAKLLLLLFAPFLLLTGCEKDEQLPNDAPRVAFSVAPQDLQGIDLNTTAGPRIKGTVQSDLGLKELTYQLVTTSGIEEIETITTFDEVDSKLYIIDYLPEYSADVVGFRVVATDIQDRVAEGSLAVSAAGGTQGPKLTLPTATVNANIREGVDIRPAIEGTAETHWGLASVSYFIVDANGEEAAGVVTDFGTSPNKYTINVTPEYRSGMTGFKVVAEDNRGNTTERVVPVEVVDAAPAPTITFDEESLTADLTASPRVEPPVTGTITTVEGLAAVRFYLVSGSSEEAFGETINTFEDPTSYAFSVQPPYRFGVTGVRVEAQDNLGQIASETIAVAVTAEDTELSTFTNVSSNAQGDRNKAGVKTNISSRNGQTYTLQEGTDPAIAETIDFITTDSGGDNGLDLFSPSHPTWLSGNYYKDADGNAVVWPVMNETKMWVLADADPAFFNSATSADIRGLSGEGDFKTRVELNPDQVGTVILFQTAQGKKGLILYKATDEAAGKKDLFTFDIKVLK